jgi:hypothetical protein
MKKTLIVLVLIFGLVYEFAFPNLLIDTESEKVDLVSQSFGGKRFVVIKIRKNSMDFSVKKRGDVDNDFFMNANFFTPKGEEIGEVTIDGKKVNQKIKCGGYFYSDGREPKISLKRPSNAKFVCQTKYVGIKNGEVNANITDTKINKGEACRTLIGKNQVGDLLIIHSDNLSLVSMRTISEFGITLGIKTGLLFDGGSSVDIKLESSDTSYKFKSVPSFAKSLIGTPEPPIYIVGNFK